MEMVLVGADPCVCHAPHLPPDAHYNAIILFRALDSIRTCSFNRSAQRKRQIPHKARRVNMKSPYTKHRFVHASILFAILLYFNLFKINVANGSPLIPDDSSIAGISDSVATSSEGAAEKKKSKGQASDVLIWGFAGGLFGGYAAAVFTHEEEDPTGLAAFENINQFILGFTVGFFAGATSYLIVKNIKMNKSSIAQHEKRSFPISKYRQNARIFGRSDNRLFLTYYLKF